MSKIKRFLALFATILVLMSVLVVPVMAYSVVPSVSDTYVSLWNIDRVEVTYVSGQVAVFDLPTDWFATSEETVNITMSYDDPENDPNVLQFTNINLIDYSDSYRGLTFNLGTYNATKIKIYFGDSFFPLASLGGDSFLHLYSPFSVSEYENWGVRVTGIYSPVKVVHGDEGNVISRTVMNYDVGTVENYGGYISLTPDSDRLRECLSYAESIADGTTDYQYYMFFHDMSAEISIDSGDRSTLNFFVPLIPYHFDADASHWISLNLPPIISFIPDDTNLSQIGSFLASVLGGFVAFEFFPGITIGGIFICIVGILSIIAFLRWFAGG